MGGGASKYDADEKKVRPEARRSRCLRSSRGRCSRARAGAWTAPRCRATDPCPRNWLQGDVGKQLTKLPPPDEPIRPHGCAPLSLVLFLLAPPRRSPARHSASPLSLLATAAPTHLPPDSSVAHARHVSHRHRKRMIIKKGCDCEWCEAVSWCDFLSRPPECSIDFPTFYWLSSGVALAPDGSSPES